MRSLCPGQFACWVQEHLKEIVGMRGGQGPMPGGGSVPHGPEAGKLEQSIQNLHKYAACNALQISLQQRAPTPAPFVSMLSHCGAMSDAA